MLNPLYPTRASEATVVQPQNYRGASTNIRQSIDDFNTYLKEQRRDNIMRGEAYASQFDLVDPMDAQQIAPEVEKFRQDYADAMSKFNTSLATPRTKEEIAKKAEFDQRYREIMGKIRYGAAINQQYEQARADWMKDPTQYPMRYQEIFRDRDAWYKMNPLDRNLNNLYKLPDTDAILRDRLKDTYQESTWTGNGLYGTEKVLYKTPEDREILVKNLGLDPAIDADVMLHFDNSLDSYGPEGRAAFMNLPQDKQIQEYEFFKSQYLGHKVDMMNGMEKKISGKFTYPSQNNVPEWQYKLMAGQGQKQETIQDIQGLANPSFDKEKYKTDNKFHRMSHPDFNPEAAEGFEYSKVDVIADSKAANIIEYIKAKGEYQDVYYAIRTGKNDPASGVKNGIGAAQISKTNTYIVFEKKDNAGNRITESYRLDSPGLQGALLAKVNNPGELTLNEMLEANQQQGGATGSMQTLVPRKTGMSDVDNTPTR